MKVFGVFLLLSLGAAFAGEGGYGLSSESVRRIPPDVLMGIKNLAVLDYPGRPREQVDAITQGVEAYFELKKVPASPAKRRASGEFPYDFPKQLYLSQRGTALGY